MSDHKKRSTCFQSGRDINEHSNVGHLMEIGFGSQTRKRKGQRLKSDLEVKWNVPRDWP